MDDLGTRLWRPNSLLLRLLKWMLLVFLCAALLVLGYCAYREPPPVAYERAVPLSGSPWPSPTTSV